MRISEEKMDELAKTLADLTNTTMIDTFMELGRSALPYAGQNQKIDDLITETKTLESNYNSFTEPWQKLISIFTEKIPEFAAHFNKYQVEATATASNDASFKDPVLPSLG